MKPVLANAQNLSNAPKLVAKCSVSPIAISALNHRNVQRNQGRTNVAGSKRSNRDPNQSNQRPS